MPFLFIRIIIFLHFCNVFAPYYKIVILHFHYPMFIVVYGILYQKLPKICEGRYFWDIQANWHPQVAPYILKAHELQAFMDCLTSLWVPTNYCSAPLKHVVNKKLSTMKAHDWHIFMQQLVLLCLCELMDQWTKIGIMCLSRNFRCICAKVLNSTNMDTLWNDITITMCMLEMTMPPVFFDIMMHLVLHLVEELDMASPIHTRWMYCVERLNKVLKGYLWNMA
jgi:hypothetical protein